MLTFFWVNIVGISIVTNKSLFLYTNADNLSNCPAFKVSSDNGIPKLCNSLELYYADMQTQYKCQVLGNIGSNFKVANSSNTVRVLRIKSTKVY